MDKVKTKKIIICTERIYFIGQRLKSINLKEDSIDYDQKLKEVLKRGKLNAKKRKDRK